MPEQFELKRLLPFALLAGLLVLVGLLAMHLRSNPIGGAPELKSAMLKDGTRASKHAVTLPKDWPRGLKVPEGALFNDAGVTVASLAVPGGAKSALTLKGVSYQKSSEFLGDYQDRLSAAGFMEDSSLHGQSASLSMIRADLETRAQVMVTTFGSDSIASAEPGSEREKLTHFVIMVLLFEVE
jgi:hypothetical protein